MKILDMCPAAEAPGQDLADQDQLPRSCSRSKQGKVFAARSGTGVQSRHGPTASITGDAAPSPARRRPPSVADDPVPVHPGDDVHADAARQQLAVARRRSSGPNNRSRGEMRPPPATSAAGMPIRTPASRLRRPPPSRRRSANRPPIRRTGRSGSLATALRSSPTRRKLQEAEMPAYWMLMRWTLARDLPAASRPGPAAALLSDPVRPLLPDSRPDLPVPAGGPSRSSSFEG